MRQFDNTLPTAIFSDSSDTQAGLFIAQDHGDGWVPIAFESHKLSDAETRYDIRDTIFFFCSEGLPEISTLVDRSKNESVYGS